MLYYQVQKFIQLMPKKDIHCILGRTSFRLGIECSFFWVIFLSLMYCRYYGGESVLARVVQTGFDTTKGQLVKSILFPTPVNLQFHKDAFKFVFVLFMIAFTGMSYCLYLYISRHVSELKLCLVGIKNKTDFRHLLRRCYFVLWTLLPSWFLQLYQPRWL